MTEEKEQKQEMVKIFIMNKPYDVPANLTIMAAFEYAGYRFGEEPPRGCGCRGGFCGACGTVWKMKGDYKEYSGLACRTVVEDGMYLTMLPYFPARKAFYNLEELKTTSGQIAMLYPEVLSCIGCGACSEICPQGLDVMDIVQAAKKGDIEKAAKLSFECIMCGLCAVKCPTRRIAQYNVAILCRRLKGRHIALKSKELEQRVKEIEQGKFDNGIEEFMNMSTEKLKDLYSKREIEK
jgi:formate hydrogenlyase subunit 6/NADH:ubiquinone oxidoreductase subunit I